MNQILKEFDFVKSFFDDCIIAEIKENENISENNVDVANNDDNVPESIFETIEDKETIINPRQRLNLRPVIKLPERFGEIYSHALKL